MNRSPNRKSSNGLILCRLPVGRVRRGKVERRAVLQPRKGDVPLRWLALDRAVPREKALSTALACCLQRLGSVSDPDAALVHSLTFCDRHALVLRLVQAAKEEISVTATCLGCNRQLDLSLELKGISPPSLHPQRRLALTRRVNGRMERRTIRLPRPADAEHAPDALGVIAACMNCSRSEARPWRAAAEQALAKHDPVGLLEIVGSCLDCGRQVSARYDLAGAWLKEVRRGSEGLLREIHVLASCYHWSEREILSLPAFRRQAYLDLCAMSEPGDGELRA